MIQKEYNIGEIGMSGEVSLKTEIDDILARSTCSLCMLREGPVIFLSDFQPSKYLGLKGANAIPVRQ